MQHLNLGPIIIRAASWPIETIDKLQSPYLAEAVDLWIEQEKIIRLNSADLSASLYTLIPTIHDDVSRHNVLSFRRYIHRTTDPIPNSLINPVLSLKMISQRLRELINCHSEARITLAAERRKLEIKYESSLIAEHDELRLIASDPVFQKALYIASPTAFEKFIKTERSCERGGLKKIDFTLYSYIIRSVGRATPNGLWASVAVETPSVGNEIDTPIRVDWVLPSRVLFTPNISLFVEALWAMVHQSPWREEIPLRLNPTLFQSTPSVWQFETYKEGIWKLLQVADQPVLSALFILFSDDLTRLPHEIQDYLLARNIVLSPAEAQKAVNHMHNVGILWSTLELPGIYDNPWQALEGIIAKVPYSEKSYWETCLADLKRISCELSLNYWMLSPEDLRIHITVAQKCISTLLVRYGVSLVSQETPVLIADMVAPFLFSISSTFRSKIEKVLRAYWDFDRYGLGEVETLIERQREYGYMQQAQNLPVIEYVRQKEVAKVKASYESLESFNRTTKRSKEPDKEIDQPVSSSQTVNPWETILHTINEPSIRDRAKIGFIRWYQELQGQFMNQQHRLQIASTDINKSPLPPGSALMLLDVKGKDCMFRIGSVTSDPCVFYSRFNLLFSEKGERDDLFVRWYRESLQSIEALFPMLQFVDLAVRAGRNPNAYSRPRTAKWILDGLNRDGSIRQIWIQVGTTDRPRLYIPERYPTILPYFHSAILPEGLDPYSRCLHNVSRMLGRTSLIRPLPLFSKEIYQWNHLPRLYLDEMAVITSERWTPPRSIVEELARTSGLDRYIAWRSFARSARLPTLVYGKYGLHQTEMLIPVDSVIAVECLGKELKVHGGNLLLREAFPSPNESWLCDRDGRHYIAELAIAWQGESSFWKDYLDGSSLRKIDIQQESVDESDE